LKGNADVVLYLQSSKPHLKTSHQVSSSAASKNFFGTSIQPSISAGIHHQTDIHQVNNTIAQMAIADFFHCENISDLVVETPRFKRMVNVLSKIGSDFEIPKRKQIGGPLLDLNFQTKYNFCNENCTFWTEINALYIHEFHKFDSHHVSCKLHSFGASWCNLLRCNLFYQVDDSHTCHSFGQSYHTPDGCTWCVRHECDTAHSHL
jgi:hypothetical protein